MLTTSLLAVLAACFTCVNGLTITSDPTSVAGKTYTHVIVGGGTAGEFEKHHDCATHKPRLIFDVSQV